MYCVHEPLIDFFIVVGYYLQKTVLYYLISRNRQMTFVASSENSTMIMRNN